MHPTHLKHGVHDSTFPEIRLKEMYHAPFRACCDVHQRLLILDFGVMAIFLALKLLCTRKLDVELLKALFPETVEGGIIVQGIKKGILVNFIGVVGGEMRVKSGGDRGV